jgi:transposase-like protein
MTEAVTTQAASEVLSGTTSPINSVVGGRRLAINGHLDERICTIKGKHHHLWRAVDQEGNMLDILVQRRRDKRVAKPFFHKLPKKQTCHKSESPKS